MLATPDSFRLNQSPLGAVLLPQALTTVGHIPSPESLSLAGVGSTFIGRNRLPIDRSFHPHGIPSYDVSLDDLLTIANALSSRRCARYAHYP